MWSLLIRFWGCRAAGAGGAVPAGVGFEGGGAEGFEAGEELADPAVVVDPGFVVAVLVGAEPAADGFGGDLAGPLAVGAVQAGRVGVAGAVAAAQRVRRSVMEPGRIMPDLAMAASSAAIFSASAWWAAATRTLSGWHRSVIPVMSYCISTV